MAHTNADGDAVGAITAFGSVLGRQYPGLQVTLMLPDGCPAQYGWMPLADRILNGQTQNAQCCQAMAEADLIVAMDLSAPSRMAMLAQAFTDSKAAKLLIDHHHDPEREAFSMVVSDYSISSTCELTLWLVDALLGPEAIDAEAATCLYVGLRTDTGGFAYSNTQPSLYMATAQLVASGIDPAEINNRILNTFSEQRLRFYGHAISNCLTVMREQGFAYFTISLADQRRFGITAEDMDGLVNYTLLMADIECGALVREEENRCKVSLRSKYTTNVNRMAADLFGGGGHTKAAGATSTLPLQATVDAVVNYILNR